MHQFVSFSFETLHKGSQQDLDTLTMSKLHGNPVPKFHYEMKSFPIVKYVPDEIANRWG